MFVLSNSLGFAPVDILAGDGGSSSRRGRRYNHRLCFPLVVFLSCSLLRLIGDRHVKEILEPVEFLFWNTV